MPEFALHPGRFPIGLRTASVRSQARPRQYDVSEARSLKTKTRKTSAGVTVAPVSAPQANSMTSPLDSDSHASMQSQRQALEAMLGLAAKGDQSAWCELVHTYTPRVFGLIRAQCANADLAEEITQSTFCTVVAKIGGYTELGKFEQWLFRIAMNRLRDEMRRRKRQARTVEDEALTGLAGAAEESDTAPDRNDPAEVIALRKAVAQLSDADQQIIHLRHYGELSFKQIAEILEQPLGTVLARQHRALKKLHELLGGGDRD
jgi:RNA polymerase sigma-70 factor, ECF subfamily